MKQRCEELQLGHPERGLTRAQIGARADRSHSRCRQKHDDRLRPPSNTKEFLIYGRRAARYRVSGSTFGPAIRMKGRKR